VGKPDYTPGQSMSPTKVLALAQMIKPDRPQAYFVISDIRVFKWIPQMKVGYLKAFKSSL